ncbi:MAG: polysaccharide biosynthesis tyrosine autokinase [Agriterribacter sp.]
MDHHRDNLKQGLYKNAEDEDNFLQKTLGKYLPWWPLFVILMAISIAAGFLYLRYATLIYESSASLLIKDEKKGLDDSNLMESLNLFGSKKIVENEIEIIRSRSIAKEVVKRLYLYAPIIQDGRVRDMSAYTFSPVWIEAKNPDSIITAKNIPFTYQKQTNTILFNNNEYSLLEWINSPYGTIRFLPNPYFTRGELSKPFHFSLINPKVAASRILANLKIAASSKQSTVINLKYRDDVPVRGENILNEIISAYNRAAVNDKNLLASNTLAFVDERLKNVFKDLDSVEHSLERFKTKNRLVDISEQGKLFLSNVGLNDQKDAELKMQLAILKEVEKYVLSRDRKSAIVPSTLGIADPVLSGLLEQLYQLETQYEKVKTTTGEGNPILLSIKDQINNIRPKIVENINNQVRNIEAGRLDVGKTNLLYQGLLQNLPSKERELLDMSRQQSIKNSIYTFLLQKREETALSYFSTVADSRVIDVAETGNIPISPKRMFVLLGAVAIAILLAIGVVEIKDMLNRNVMFRSEIEKYTSAPILGEIAFDQSDKALVISEGKRSFIAEQFRQLRTSLGYLGVNARKKKIMLTSSISGEGKSFITANLGVSLALMGKKVVIIELDLRKPKLSDAFNVSRTRGISNYFIGDMEAEEIIKSTEVSNLFLIPSGPIPPNPSELIMNGRMQELLAYLEMHFDYVIVDTAPVNPVTDAFIISPMCDATLFVIRHGYTPRIYLQKLDEQNRIRELKNMAIVFNGVKNRGYSSYGYGYGYGYGYTDDGNESGAKRKRKTKKKSDTQA